MKLSSYSLIFFLLALAFNVHAGNYYRGWDGFHLESLKEELNIQLVSDAMDALFVRGEADAIEKYWAKNYVQHNPTIGNGREVLQAFTLENRSENFNFEMGSIMAEGDFVAVHSRLTGFSETPLILVDIYRVKLGKIVEHWDVIQEEVPASESVNGNAMFPIESVMFPSRDEEANRALAVSVINNVFGLGNIDMIDEVYDESYIQHNPFIPNGREVVKDVIRSINPEEFSFEVGFAMAYGDFVLLHSRVQGFPGFDIEGGLIAVDIFRFEDGKIMEHWDVVQEEVVLQDTANGNPMFPVF